MGTRIYAAWGGNRVYNGSAWMELYHALELELTGGANVQLTGNGKIPNDNPSVLGRQLVDAVFDSNTLDNGNTFTLGGGVWPSFSGSVSIPTVSAKQVYNQTALLYPNFGSSKTFRVTASLTGIDRVPGTTSFDKYLSIPARAWAKPDVPTVIGAEVVGSTVYLDVSGHQNNQAADKYWQAQDKTIYDYATGQWTETYGLAGNLTYHSWPVVENNSYRLGARTWNEDGGLSAWTPWARIYTKPTAPTGLTAVRRSGDRTTVDLSWNNTAAYVGSTRIFRWSGTTWVEVGSVSGTGTTWSETRPLGSNPEYRVRTRVPDGSVQSDSTTVATPVEYLLPDAPTNVLLALNAGGDTATVTFSGHQTNPAVDRYWSDVARQLDTNGVLGDETVDPNGDVASFTFPGLVGNSRYRARVYAKNDAGAGSPAFSNYVYTKPLAATNVVVARDGISESVSGSFISNAAYAGSHLVYRSVDGGPSTLVATLPAGTTTFTDSVPMTATATYTVTTQSPIPITQADPSAVSNTIPFVGYDKDGIPGVDDIFVGTDKVYKVMAGTNQIWLG